ncbi:hypothetical protein [Ktedonospora formicarum]|uniref:Uncharacterized protein n=1 Tax=Ktedonospora formicarum TaxID=2778364 RepID=A0A8J3I7U6_9CHLR|nr:hypothetical protein [Ktedonospora formicarum]GHO48450.1 hypothetical protein KSX_66130 [Ktedonospora formicarum]
MGEGNITIHDRKRQRYRCKICRQTFNAKCGTMFEGLRKPMEVIVIVVTLLSYGCPVQAIVHAFDLDERTSPVGEIAQGPIVNRSIMHWLKPENWIWSMCRQTSFG